MIQVVDLTRPHGFLIWRGKQQSIASPTPLPTGEVMITSDGEAFGIATLSQPSQVSLSEFERESTKHCMRPEERLELWPQVESFYLYDIKGWKGFGEPWLIISPTPEVTIENNKGLLKTIIIHPDANGSIEDMSVTLEATFNCVKHEGEKALPFYELKLKGEPILRFEDVKKKEVMTMPYDIDENECVVNTETDEVEKCHNSHEEAMAHLAALNINVTKDKKMEGQKRSLQELSRVQERFMIKFCRDDYTYRDNPWPVDVTDDSKVITNWRGSLYEVPFTIAENGEIVFTSQNQWIPVTTQYVAGAAKTTTDFPGLDEAITTGHDKAGRRLAGSWRDKLRAAKDALMELVSWAEYADQVEEEESMADMLKGDSGVAVKMVSGEPWHLSWSSNAFEDRDEEIFSLKSLEQYVQENWENEVKGYFNLWHIKNTDFAEKRYQAVIGKFLFEAGPYLKDEKGQKALEFFKQYSAGHPEIAPEGWGASVEYKYLPEERQQKVYQWTWITRTSTLARGAAANVWTKSTQQEFIMNDEQRKAAVAIFGEEFTNGLISQGQQKTKELEDAGVANKQADPKPVETEGDKVAEAIDPNQLMQELAAKMQASLNEGLTPVLTEFQQQIIALGEQVKTLGEEIKAIKGEQALKAAVEMPRFTFQALRASQSTETVVPEGNALKDKKPQEANPVANTGSLVTSYFPAAKG